MSDPSDKSSVESASDIALTPFQEFIGYRVVEARDGFAVMEIDLREEFGNRTGRVHGGVVMILIDSVGGYCGCADDDGNLPRRCVSLGVSTNFQDVPRTGPIRAEGTVLKRGRSVFFARMDVFDGNDTLVATGEGTYKYLNPRT